MHKITLTWYYCFYSYFSFYASNLPHKIKGLFEKRLKFPGMFGVMIVHTSLENIPLPRSLNSSLSRAYTFCQRLWITLHITTAYQVLHACCVTTVKLLEHNTGFIHQGVTVTITGISLNVNFAPHNFSFEQAKTRICRPD